MPVNNSAVPHTHTYTHTQPPPPLPLPTVPSSGCGFHEGPHWRGLRFVGYFQLWLAPVAPSIDGTAAARRRGLWVMPPLACGCWKPFLLLSHTAARQTVHAAAAAARLTVCSSPPPTAGPDNTTCCSKHMHSTDTHTHNRASLTDQIKVRAVVPAVGGVSVYQLCRKQNLCMCEHKASNK